MQGELSKARTIWDRRNCSEQHIDEQGSYTFLRTFIQLSSVRNPNRPICTGPRQDNGFPSFPYDVLSSWTLHSDTVSDTVKVVRHILPRTPTPRSLVDGSSGTIYHALHSGPAHLTTAAGPNILNRIWKDFQAQGPYEMRFKRNLLTKVSRRRKSILLVLGMHESPLT